MAKRLALAAALFILIVATMACEQPGTSNTVRSAAAPSRDNWDALSKSRVFFGHQSVGYNILEGVDDLMRTQRPGALKIAETTTATSLTPGVIAHAKVGQNTDPSSKVRGFAEYLRGGLGGRVDVAMLKFCYIDIDATTDVNRLFSEYKSTMTALQQEFPNTRLVHVTAPLRMVQTGPKAVVKRILGRAPGGYRENSRRNAYNDLLRAEYAGRAPVFDIAAIEATLGDGGNTTYSYEGRQLLALNPAYTFDNGHLNERGRQVVAQEFLQVLGAAVAPRNQ
jgi:hypothetical protein